jgi:hypothetical protein
MSEKLPSNFDAATRLLNTAKHELSALEQVHASASEIFRQFKGVSQGVDAARTAHQVSCLQLEDVALRRARAGVALPAARAEYERVRAAVETARTCVEERRGERAKKAATLERVHDDRHKLVKRSANAWETAIREIIRRGEARLSQGQSEKDLRRRRMVEVIECTKRDLETAEQRLLVIEASSQQRGMAALKRREAMPRVLVWRESDALLEREIDQLPERVDLLRKNLKNQDAALRELDSELELLRRQPETLKQRIPRLEALSLRAGAAVSLEEVESVEADFDALTEEFTSLESEAAKDARRNLKFAKDAIGGAQCALETAREAEEQASRTLDIAEREEGAEAARLESIEQAFSSDTASFEREVERLSQALIGLAQAASTLEESLHRTVFEGSSIADEAVRASEVAVAAASDLRDPERFSEIVATSLAMWQKSREEVSRSLFIAEDERGLLLVELKDTLRKLVADELIKAHSKEAIGRWLAQMKYEEAVVSMRAAWVPPEVCAIGEEACRRQAPIFQLKNELEQTSMVVERTRRVLASLDSAQDTGKIDPYCRDLDAVAFVNAWRAVELRFEAKQTRDRVTQIARDLDKLLAT